MTFNPSSLMHMSCFLRASPAQMMAGGTQASKSFIITTVLTDGLAWLLPREGLWLQTEGGPCSFAFHLGVPHRHGRLEPGSASPPFYLSWHCTSMVSRTHQPLQLRQSHGQGSQRRPLTRQLQSHIPFSVCPRTPSFKRMPWKSTKVPKLINFHLCCPCVCEGLALCPLSLGGTLKAGH